jgi:hypothetical protein
MAALNSQSQKDDPKQIEEMFLVPYQANPQFIGRQAFLETLKEKLFQFIPRHNNHRVALYGMGGIGNLSAPWDTSMRIETFIVEYIGFLQSIEPRYYRGIRVSPKPQDLVICRIQAPPKLRKQCYHG